MRPPIDDTVIKQIEENQVPPALRPFIDSAPDPIAKPPAKEIDLRDMSEKARDVIIEKYR